MRKRACIKWISFTSIRLGHDSQLVVCIGVLYYEVSGDLFSFYDQGYYFTIKKALPKLPRLIEKCIYDPDLSDLNFCDDHRLFPRRTLATF